MLHSLMHPPPIIYLTILLEWWHWIVFCYNIMIAKQCRRLYCYIPYLVRWIVQEEFA